MRGPRRGHNDVPSEFSSLQTSRISFTVLFQLCALLVVVSSCPHSPSAISEIHSIEACNGSDFLLTFTFLTNLTDGLECTPGIYVMHIFTHDFNLSTADQLTEVLPPVHDNVTNLCTYYVIINDMTYEKYDGYDGKLLQIWMRYPSGGPLYCSNNFTANISTGPPGQVNVSSIHSVGNCTGLYLYWTPPITPTGCEILNYTLQWNDTVVTTEEPFYYWPAAELPSNEVLAVSIEAVNGNGPGNETSINISTTTEPVVNILNHTVHIVSSTAQLIVNAELDSDCPFSSPSLLYICTMCNDSLTSLCSYINLTIYNDAMITFNTTLPLDLLQCVSNLTWSNLHSSYISHINNTFSTSPVHSVFISNNSSTGYFRFSCTLLPGGSGCAIKVFNNSSGLFIFMEVLMVNDTFIVSDDDYKIVSKTTTHQLMASGTYTVNVYSLKDNDSVGDVVIASRVIEVALPSPSHTLLPSPSHTSTPSPTCVINCSNSNSPGNDISTRDAYIIGIVVTVFVTIVIICLVIIYVMYRLFCKRPKKSSCTQDRKEIKLIKVKYNRPEVATTRHPNDNSGPSSEVQLLDGTLNTSDTSDKDLGDDAGKPAASNHRIIKNREVKYKRPEGATTRHPNDNNGPSSDVQLLGGTLSAPNASDKDLGNEAENSAATNHDPQDEEESYLTQQQSDTNGFDSAPVTGIVQLNIPSDDIDGKKEVTTETSQTTMPEGTHNLSKKYVAKESEETGVNNVVSKCTIQ